MPKIVDKEQKRRDIAASCSELLHEVGIKKLTVAQVAKTAGIGKGTVYEYFENKGDIVFEIINIHIEEYLEEFLKSIKNVETTKEKVFHFFKFVLDDSEENMKYFNGYKEYLSIVLSEDNKDMIEFNRKCNIFFRAELRKIIQEGVDNKELILEAIDLCDGLLTFEKGLALYKMTDNTIPIKDDCERFINTFFKLIEVKK
jgi:AcrR family transcriptional regulator